MSSGTAFPTIEVRSLIENRAKIRTELWEPDFEQNYEMFAETLADGIAKRQIEQFGLKLSDPFRKSLGPDDKVVTCISLDLTDQYRKTAESLQKLVGSAASLSPFREWMEKFLQTRNPEDPNDSPKKFTEADKKYFQELMAIVGQCAAKKLNDKFANYVADPKHVDIRFKVDWIRKDDHIIGNPSDFNDNCLQVAFWLNSEALTISPLSLQSTHTITQYRTKSLETQKIRTRNLRVITVAVLLIAFLVYQSNVVNRFFDHYDT